MPVVVIRHWRERLKSSNSARALAAAIEPCAILDRGALDTPFSWAPEAGDALLYPPDGGPVADPASVRRLVVLDGTWKQARKALHHVPGLIALPRLPVPPRRDALRLRRPPRDDVMSTAEAVAQALRVLGDGAAADQVEAILDRQVAAIASLRGWDAAG